MTINEIMNVLENNYKEIDIFDHIAEWTKQATSDHSEYIMHASGGEGYKITVQALTHYPSEDGNEPPVEEIYIGYTDDPNNIIHKAFKSIEDSEQKLYYSDIVNLDFDMGWV